MAQEYLDGGNDPLASDTPIKLEHKQAGALAEIAAAAKVSSGAFQRVQTPATGTNWAKPAAIACDQASLKNNTGTTLRIARGAGGVEAAPTDVAKYLTLLDGETWLVRGITNADQVYVKRNDESNTQVTLSVETEVL